MKKNSLRKLNFKKATISNLGKMTGGLAGSTVNKTDFCTTKFIFCPPPRRE